MYEDGHQSETMSLCFLCMHTVTIESITCSNNTNSGSSEAHDLMGKVGNSIEHVILFKVIMQVKIG